MKKREFMSTAASALALVGSSLPALSAQAEASLQPRLNSTPRLPPLDGGFSLSRWQRYLGESFHMQTAGASQKLTVHLVQDNPVRQAGLEQFSVVFTTTGETLEAGCYALRHASGQQFSLYLEPSEHAAPAYRAHFALLS